MSQHVLVEHVPATIVQFMCTLCDVLLSDISALLVHNRGPSQALSFSTMGVAWTCRGSLSGAPPRTCRATTL